MPRLSAVGISGIHAGEDVNSHDAESPPACWNSRTAAQLAAYRRLFPGERDRIAPLLHALARGDDVASRLTESGHVTASGIVVRCGRLLTVRHPQLRRWIQPGGHLDAGELPQQAALRETTEETGAAARLHRWHEAHRCPIDIDVHPIPANPARGEAAHWHYDLRYLLVCRRWPAIAAELPTRWAVPAQLDDPGLEALMHKLRALHLDEAAT
ncbi:putative DHNTP pyrophosphohydrolase [mine drainage metagenome]|jgi:8-oxo-dGTP pyrophosphatase MutT (NUDIX family)|uniref:Putative DHNTP pyrophosphohydrolase n=1 Tax=mine drainage metagenome TaxID=410659 RepID=A0A1J5QDQ7_9ZZZZ